MEAEVRENEKMTTRASRLVALCCDKLGINKEELLASESLRRLHFDGEVAASLFALLTLDDFKTLAEDFPNSVYFHANSVTLIEAGQVRLQDDATVTSIAQVDPCKLTIEIDKKELAAHWAPNDMSCNPIAYIFLERFLTFLAAAVPTLDRELFADRYTPTVVFVSSHPDLAWEGSSLNVIGEKAFEDHPETHQRLTTRLATAGRPQRKRRLDRYHETARSSISWLGFELKNVTPLHFLGTCHSGDGSQRVENQAARQMLHAILLFTANRSHFKEWIEGATRKRALEVQYSSEDQVVAIELGRECPSVSTQDLARLALWPYQSEGNDRLIVFSNIVARALEPQSLSEQTARARNYCAMIENPPKLLADAMWSYRTWVSRRIEHHFDAMRRAESSAIETARDLSLALDAVTRGLSETLLTTIGVIVLTLLASVVKGDADGVIFELGMRAYAIYLICFQLIYRMASVWHSYRLTMSEWHYRKASFRGLVSPSAVARLSGSVNDRKRQLDWWFWITVILYLAVAVGIWMLPDQALLLLGAQIETATSSH